MNEFVSFQDYLVTRYLYEDVELYSPGKMTDLRSALVNNYLFSVIAVRNKFHNYLKHLNSNLQASIDKFAQRQEECGHMVLDEVLLHLKILRSQLFHLFIFFNYYLLFIFIMIIIQH